MLDSESSAYQFGYILGFVLSLVVIAGVALSFLISLIMLIRSKKRGWLFLLIPSGVAGLLIAGAMVFGIVRGIQSASRTGYESAQVLPEDRVMVSEDNLVQVKLPSHWNPMKDLNDDAQIQAGNARREEYMMVINDPKSDFDGTLDEYGKVVVDLLTQNLENTSVTGPEKITINGNKGLQFEISGKIERINLRYLFTVFETSSSFHQLVQWTLNSKRDTAFPIFQKVLETFDSSDKAPAASES